MSPAGQATSYLMARVSFPCSCDSPPGGCHCCLVWVKSLASVPPCFYLHSKIVTVSPLSASSVSCVLNSVCLKSIPCRPQVYLTLLLEEWVWLLPVGQVNDFRNLWVTNCRGLPRTASLSVIKQGRSQANHDKVVTLRNSLVNPSCPPAKTSCSGPTTLCDSVTSRPVFCLASSLKPFQMLTSQL